MYVCMNGNLFFSLSCYLFCLVIVVVVVAAAVIFVSDLSLAPYDYCNKTHTHIIQMSLEMLQCKMSQPQLQSVFDCLREKKCSGKMKMIVHNLRFNVDYFYIHTINSFCLSFVCLLLLFFKLCNSTYLSLEYQ